MGFCQWVGRSVAALGVVGLAYAVGGPALAAMGSIGCVWAFSTNSNTLVNEGSQNRAEFAREGAVVALPFPLTQGMNEVERSKIFEVIAQIHAADREQVVALA